VLLIGLGSPARQPRELGASKIETDVVGFLRGQALARRSSRQPNAARRQREVPQSVLRRHRRYQKVTPTEYISERVSIRVCPMLGNCSGLAKAGVPMKPVWVCSAPRSASGGRTFSDAVINHFHDGCARRIRLEHDIGWLDVAVHYTARFRGPAAVMPSAVGAPRRALCGTASLQSKAALLRFLSPPALRSVSRNGRHTRSRKSVLSVEPAGDAGCEQRPKLRCLSHLRR
jgi:hypothetical protein